MKEPNWNELRGEAHAQSLYGPQTAYGPYESGAPHPWQQGQTTHTFPATFPSYPQGLIDKMGATQEQHVRYSLRAWEDEVQREASNILGLMLQSSECRKEDKAKLAQDARDTAEALLALMGKNKPKDQTPR